jgi:hypothetical protein
MGEIAKLAKSICIVVTVLSVILLIGVLVPDDSTPSPAPVPTPASTPASTPTPETVESSIEELVVVRSGRDHQDITVECKHLRVDSSYNAIQVANSDVESIRILGSGNSISYSSGADPRIDDFGNYNDVWQRWLT